MICFAKRWDYEKETMPEGSFIIMGLLALIKRIDSEIADAYAGTPWYFSLSPTRLCLTATLFPLLEKYVHGCCLDAGAGRSSYESVLRNKAQEYYSIDIQKRPVLSVQGSVLKLPVRNGSIDTVFCSQVLEHVPEPETALREFYLCLKPGGILLLTAPHLAYLHNEPHDYFRYTKHGLRFLLEKTGFAVVDIQPAGGLLCFITHIPSMIFKAIFYKIPFIRGFIIIVNSILSRCMAWIDKHVDNKKLFALNYIAIARKPKGSLDNLPFIKN